MKNLLSLRKRTEQITLLKIITADILPLLIISGIVLAVSIGIILLIGSAGKSGSLYDDGIHGMQFIPFLNPILAIGAAVLLNQSLRPITWISVSVSILTFSDIHHNTILGSMLHGSILPYIVGILCVIFIFRTVDAMQTRALPGKLISLPGTLIYPILLVLLVTASFIRLA